MTHHEPPETRPILTVDQEGEPKLIFGRGGVTSVGLFGIGIFCGIMIVLFFQLFAPSFPTWLLAPIMLTVMFEVAFTKRFLVFIRRHTVRCNYLSRYYVNRKP